MVSPTGMKNNTKCFIALVGAAIGRPNREVLHRGLWAADGRPYERSGRILITPNSAKKCCHCEGELHNDSFFYSALNSTRSLLMPCWWKAFSRSSGVVWARSGPDSSSTIFPSFIIRVRLPRFRAEGMLWVIIMQVM